MGMFCTCCGAIPCVIHSTIGAAGKPFDWNVLSGSPAFDGDGIQLSGPALIECTHDQLQEHLQGVVPPDPEFIDTWEKPFAGIIVLKTIDSRVRLYTHYKDANTYTYYEWRVYDDETQRYPIVWMAKREVGPYTGEMSLAMCVCLDRWRPDYRIFFNTHKEDFPRAEIYDFGGGGISGFGWDGFVEINDVGISEKLSPCGLITLLDAIQVNVSGSTPVYGIPAAQVHSTLSTDTSSIYNTNVFRIENVEGDSEFQYLTLHQYVRRSRFDPSPPTWHAECPWYEEPTASWLGDNDGTAVYQVLWPGGSILPGTIPSAVNVVLPNLTGPDACCSDGNGGVLRIPFYAGGSQVFGGVAFAYRTIYVGPYGCSYTEAQIGTAISVIFQLFALPQFGDQFVNLPNSIDSAAYDTGEPNIAGNSYIKIDPTTSEFEGGLEIVGIHGTHQSDFVPTKYAYTLMQHVLPPDWKPYPDGDPSRSAHTPWVGFNFMVAIDHARFYLEPMDTNPLVLCAVSGPGLNGYTLLDISAGDITP